MMSMLGSVTDAQVFSRELSDQEMMDMVNQQESPDKLPFLNVAWQNKHRTIRQYC